MWNRSLKVGCHIISHNIEYLYIDSIDPFIISHQNIPGMIGPKPQSCASLKKNQSSKVKGPLKCATDLRWFYWEFFRSSGSIIKYHKIKRAMRKKKKKTIWFDMIRYCSCLISYCCSMVWYPFPNRNDRNDGQNMSKSKAQEQWLIKSGKAMVFCRH